MAAIHYVYIKAVEDSNFAIRPVEAVNLKNDIQHCSRLQNSFMYDEKSVNLYICIMSFGCRPTRVVVVDSCFQEVIFK